MVSGAPFQAGKLIPVSDLNKKTLSHTESLSTEVKLPGQIWYNLVDNGAFLKDDIVAWNADEDGYVFLSMAKHTHDADTNAAGGTLRDIFAKNLSSFLYFNRRVGFSGAEFKYIVSSENVTGALDLTSGALKFNTSANSNEYVTGVLMGIPLSFEKYSVAETDMQFTGNITNQFCRYGLAMEAMNVTNDSDVKYGIESCAATNGDWFLVSADGDTRSQQDSLKPLLGDSDQQTYRIENTVGVSVDFTYADDSAVSKLSNLPETGSSPKNNILSFGIKTIDANAKQLYIWGLSMVGES